MDSFDRPPLSKTRSTSSSFQQGRRPSRTASTKYGSIVEERKQKHADNEEESDYYEIEQEQDNGIFEIPEENEDQQEGIRQRTLTSERMSIDSFDHEITLKERQDVSNFFNNFFFLNFCIQYIYFFL